VIAAAVLDDLVELLGAVRVGIRHGRRAHGPLATARSSRRHAKA